MSVSSTRVRVRYAETDQMGVAYHANFLVWFEVGRVELLRQIGFAYKEMETDDDCHIAVVEATCRIGRRRGMTTSCWWRPGSPRYGAP